MNSFDSIGTSTFIGNEVRISKLTNDHPMGLLSLCMVFSNERKRIWERLHPLLIESVENIIQQEPDTNDEEVFVKISIINGKHQQQERSVFNIVDALNNSVYSEEVV